MNCYFVGPQQVLVLLQGLSQLLQDVGAAREHDIAGVLGRIFGGLKEENGAVKSQSLLPHYFYRESYPLLVSAPSSAVGGRCRILLLHSSDIWVMLCGRRPFIHDRNGFVGILRAFNGDRTTDTPSMTVTIPSSCR